VFEDNWTAVKTFVAASTQWVMGFSGATGLNYQSIDFLFKLYNIKDRKTIFEEIQVIEAAALKKIKELQESNKGKNGT